MAPAKISAENATVTDGEMSWRIRAGTAPMKPTMPAISPSLELASTSSASVRTTLGTRALLQTAYALDSTSVRNANGNSARPSRWVIMKTLTTPCPTAQATTMARRPPAIRSIAGPTSGATIVNGSIVNSR